MMQTFRWTREHVAAIGQTPYPTVPLIAPGDAPGIASDLDIWDHWPALTPDGALATVKDGLLVVALSSPIFEDPEQRHAHARLRLFHRHAEQWCDLGSSASRRLLARQPRMGGLGGARRAQLGPLLHGGGPSR
jgi:levansucrase